MSVRPAENDNHPQHCLSGDSAGELPHDIVLARRDRASSTRVTLEVLPSSSEAKELCIPVRDRPSKVAADASDHLVKEINRSLTTLLAFTGLFSVVITTFLNLTRRQGITLSLLHELQSQFRLRDNYTAPEPSCELLSEFASPDILIVSHGEWACTMWYLSLTLCYGAALVAACIKRWIYSYMATSRANEGQFTPYDASAVPRSITLVTFVLLPATTTVVIVVFVAGLVVLGVGCAFSSVVPS